MLIYYLFTDCRSGVEQRLANAVNVNRKKKHTHTASMFLSMQCAANIIPTTLLLKNNDLDIKAKCPSLENVQV